MPLVFDCPSVGFALWFRLAALCVVVAIVAGIVLVLVTEAFVAWGVIGGFLAIAVVLMLIGWVTDRRRAMQ